MNKVIIIILSLMLIVLLGIETFTIVKYGGQSASEIPAWVFWFWFGGGK